MKPINQRKAGLLMPLPIPNQVWKNITMDFITDLPQIQGKTVIMVTVDRLSKYAHFGALTPNFNAPMVSELFTNMVVKLHGIPESIISDRDRIFTSKFWRELHAKSGTKLQYSTAYHPETDGQSEVVNRGLEMYLRCFCHEDPKTWLKLLPWAELWYNTSYHSSIQTTPFNVLYGRDPPGITHYNPGDSNIDAVDMNLQVREEALSNIKACLQRSQQSMKAKADKTRTDFQFKVNQWVWVKLKPYRQFSMANRLNNKLCKRYFGPFKITKKISPAAYTLALPRGSKIHNSFHISKLKAYIGPIPPKSADYPIMAVNNQPILYPISIIDFRKIYLRGEQKMQVLVNWSDTPPEDASWENLDELKKAFPAIDSEDMSEF